MAREKTFLLRLDSDEEKVLSVLSAARGENKSTLIRRLLYQEAERRFVVPDQYFDELVETLDIPDPAPALRRAAELSKKPSSAS